MIKSKLLSLTVQYIFLQSRQRDLYMGHYKITFSWKINGEPRDVGRSGKGIVLSPTLISGRSPVFSLTSHNHWHLYDKSSTFLFELKIKVPRGNYAMGYWHFNKLGSHILLIMVNLIVAIKPGKTKPKKKKVVSFSCSSGMYFVLLR